MSKFFKKAISGLGLFSLAAATGYMCFVKNLNKNIFPYPKQEGDFFKEIPFNDYIDFDFILNSENEIYDIKDFGAHPGKEDNTIYINEAILKCSENGGGIVKVSYGNFKAGTIILKDNVTLYIEKNSSLVAIHEFSKFNKSFIYAKNAKNIKIIGPGKICGEGEFFNYAPAKKPSTKQFFISNVHIMDRFFRRRVRYEMDGRPSALLLFENCDVIELSNLIFENSMNWTVHINSSNEVVIKNVIIDNNRHTANSDGIDIVGTSNTKISNCFISTGDDGIVLKSLKENKMDMKNIHVENCKIISTTNSFKIGTETYYNIKNVSVKDCEFYLPDLYPGTISGIAIESADGSIVEDVTVKNIKMNNVTCPIFIRLCTRNRFGAVDNKPTIKNILIESIIAENAFLPSIVAGVRDDLNEKLKVSDITLKNISVIYNQTKAILFVKKQIPEFRKRYPESWYFGDLPAYGIWARYFENLNIENFEVIPRENEKREKIYLEK